MSYIFPREAITEPASSQFKINQPNPFLFKMLPAYQKNRDTLDIHYFSDWIQWPKSSDYVKKNGDTVYISYFFSRA